MNPFKMAKKYNIMPKWRNFPKSGHTVRGPAMVTRCVAKKYHSQQQTNCAIQKIKASFDGLLVNVLIFLDPVQMATS